MPLSRVSYVYMTYYDSSYFYGFILFFEETERFAESRNKLSSVNLAVIGMAFWRATLSSILRKRPTNIGYATGNTAEK